MGWLHEWIGFLGGLVLVVCFTAGSLALFDIELTRWMQPELARYHPAPLSDAALDKVGGIVAQMRQNGRNAFITLPTPRDPILRVLHFNGHAFLGTAYSPTDGFPVLTRPTDGGQLFFDLHHSLYRGPFWGNMVTEIAAIGLLIAVGSGLIIHFRSIIPDLLLFRPFASRTRAWMDAHILAGLLFLPFMVMMAYTGAVIHGPRLFPMFGGGHHGRPGLHRPSGDSRATYAPLSPMLHEAEKIFGPATIGLILFENGTVSMTRADSSSFVLTRDHAVFSAQDGTLVDVVRQKDPSRRLGGILRGLHFIRWAPLPLRWLYFLSGIAGSALMSAGLILFLMKHRDRRGSRFLFRLAETLTMGVTTALPIACLGYLWANRLFWSDLPERAHWEIEAFFLVWAVGLVHAAWRSFGPTPLRGWNEHFVLFASFALTVLPLDFLTRTSNGYLSSFDVYKAVDFTAFAFGLLALFIHRRLATS